MMTNSPVCSECNVVYVRAALTPCYRESPPRRQYAALLVVV